MKYNLEKIKDYGRSGRRYMRENPEETIVAGLASLLILGSIGLRTYDALIYDNNHPPREDKKYEKKLNIDDEPLKFSDLIRFPF